MTATRFARWGTTRAVLSAGLALAFIAGCDNPAKPKEGAGDPENISRVTLTLVPGGGGTTVTSFRVDPDGTQLPQPVGAAQGTLALSKGKTYAGTIVLLNDIDPNNVINISNEVENESDFHRFFYSFSGCTGVANPDPASFDTDSQNPAQPLGLTFVVVVPAGAATTTSCTLHVELHHFESAKGDGLGSTFDTDLSLDFPVSIS